MSATSSEVSGLPGLPGSKAQRPRQASIPCHSMLCNWVSLLLLYCVLDRHAQIPCTIADINILEGFLPNPNDSPPRGRMVRTDLGSDTPTMLMEKSGSLSSQVPRPGAIPALPGLICLSLKNSSTGVQTETPGPVGTCCYSTPGARVGSNTWFCRCKNDARPVGLSLSPSSTLQVIRQHSL